MSTTKPTVNCTVANCSFWGSGNKCQANEIVIDIDAVAHARYQEEFAAEGFHSDRHESAPTSSVTCCHTFKPKSSGGAHE